jgi:site-specific DNA-methyltransferase (adenine-specific)
MTARRTEIIHDCTLYLGDCLEILPTLPKVDAVVTDPPYLNLGDKIDVNFTSGVAPRRNTNKTIGDPWGATLLWVPGAFALASKAFFSFCSFHFIADLCRAVPIKPCALVTWRQSNSMPPIANAPHFQTEFCWAFRKGKGVNWRALKTFYDIPRLQSGCFAKERIVDDSGQAIHPSQKPVSLIEKLLLDGLENVLDPFSGTGTTGVACVNLGRKFIGIEIEEKYFDIACKRIENAYRGRPRLFDSLKKDKPKPMEMFK